MHPIKLQSAAEQIAAHLCKEISRGSLSGSIPGAKNIAAELGVNHKTVATAVGILEAKGFLVSHPSRRRRSIVIPESTPMSALRIAILDYDPPARIERSQIGLLHLLRESGHDPFYTAKTLTELQMDTRRIASLVKQVEADAWIICSAPREISEWFAEQDIAVFALFGARRGILIAGVGPDYVPALQCALRRLVELGHHRIVTLIDGGRAKLGSGHTEHAILDEMEKQGLQTGPYNLPSWENSREGFRQCLDSLFKHTPPSALLIEEPTHLFATLQFCGERGLRVPQDVSLVCFENPPSFALGKPAISNLHWDYHPMARRITRWANNVARGKEDQRQTRIKVEFIEGGSIGPAQ